MTDLFFGYFNRRFHDYKCLVRLEVCTRCSHRFSIHTIADFSKKFDSLLHLSIFFPLLLGTDLSHFLSVCYLALNVEMYQQHVSRSATRVVGPSSADVCVRQTHAAPKTQQDELWKKVPFVPFLVLLFTCHICVRLYNRQRNNHVQVLCNTKICTELWINERSHTLRCIKLTAVTSILHKCHSWNVIRPI